jgi:general secretion pathway protein B
MSYILDALKKADTERERSAVPGLHAQADGGSGIGDRRGGLPWGVIALAAIVLLAAVLAWAWFGRDEPAAAAPAPVAQTAPTPIATPQPTPAPATTPSPPVAPPARPPTQAPIAHMPPPAPAPPTATVATPTAPTTPSTKAPTAAATAPASAADTRIPGRNELPPEVRAALPPLNVSGAVYAPQPAGRMLFVNGLVLREGDAVGEGLSVERIGPSASVLVFRGQRFELKH